jgi:transcriptional regulator with XRE-family HTH domain
MAYIVTDPLPSPATPTIGDRIRQFAEHRFGSLNGFAQAIGMHPVQLSKYALNQSKPGAEILVRFQQAGMSIDWLLSGKSQWLRETLVMQPAGDTIGEILAYLQELTTRLTSHVNNQRPTEWG